jgi:hypothetical protein
VLVEILIGGRLHGMRREWSAVPAIGQDVWVKNVFGASRSEPYENVRDGALKVVAVVWHEDKVQVNLETPTRGKFGLSE